MTEVITGSAHGLLPDARWLRDRGASAAAIQHHYDLPPAFFASWLDPELIYTCALWDRDRPDQSLAEAQLRKIDFYAEALELSPGARLLDIGCGWGGTMRRFRTKYGVAEAVGLTLSRAQRDRVLAFGEPEIEARLESWVDYHPDRSFDGAICIEAIEAFACPALARSEKVEIYRAFLSRVRSWLKPSRCFGLQMIAYGTATAEDFDSFIAEQIFPQSDLPHLSEVMEACQGLFEPILIRNDRADYVRTLRGWLRNLKNSRDRTRQIAGDRTQADFENYLRLSWRMFQTGACDLYRILLRRVDG